MAITVFELAKQWTFHPVPHAARQAVIFLTTQGWVEVPTINIFIPSLCCIYTVKHYAHDHHNSYHSGVAKQE